ncbi:hypothetical protein ACFL6X_00060 [Candidatus Latescibacterota bacterium]
MASREWALSTRVAARFALAVSLLFALWTQVAGAYTASLVSPSNWLLELRAAPVEIFWNGEACLVGLAADNGSRQVFQLQGDDLAYVNLVAALAILAAIPGLSLRRRAIWGLGVAAVLWATHVVTLYGGTCAAVSAYLSSAPGSEISLGGFALADGGDTLEELIGRWSAWGSPALILAVSVMAFPRGIWRGAHASGA